MVCKEELCNWFKNLSPHKRIDFMCGMLNMCHPMELRFLGSFIEDLAKKDFLHLRESEGKANSRNELSNLTMVDENLFRTKMAVFLGLLHSSNRHCSTIIFNLIDNNVQQVFTVRDNMDAMTIHNILLVLSMGMYHPAFSHSQRTRMYEHYKAAYDATDTVSSQVTAEPEMFPGLILAESCETRSCDMELSPACSPRVQASRSQTAQKVYVCDVEVKGSRQRQYHDQRLVEYRIQVTWSNGERKEIYKTVQELLDFHGKLMQSFPDDLSFLKQEKKFPMIHGSNNHIVENKEQINIYTRYLSQLPQHIRQCNHMISFFENGTPVPIPERPSRTSQDAATSPCLQPQLPDLPSYTQLPIPDIPIGGQLSPGQHELPFSSHSPSLSGKTASPLINSPCQSPESSLNDSPVNSRSNSPMLPGLKPEDIEKLNLQKNSDIRLKNILNAREKGVPLQNGLIDTRLLLDSPPPTHHPYLPSQPGPPLTYPAHLGPPHLYPIFSYHQPPNLSPRMRDMSPTNSECSSPSPSPMPLPRSPHVLPTIRPHLTSQQSDSSSDDNDKGRRQFPGKGNMKLKNHFSVNKTQIDDERRRSEQLDNNSNAGTPPLPKDGKSESATTGYGSSGYTSDPTYNARQQMPGPWYKAQPAHTTIGVRPKNANLMSMPEHYPKPGEIPVPMAMPQHLRDYAMAAAGHPGPEHFAQRPYMIYPGMFNRPQFINGNRPMYISAPSSHSVNNTLQTQPSTSNANKPPYHNGGGILPSPNMNGVNGVPQPNVMANGVEPKGGADMSTGQRPPLIPSMPATSSTTVTVTTASQSAQPTPSVTTSQHSCTSCGCPGHSHPATYPYQVPQIPPQNLWPVPFSNGLLPIHLQHAFIPHHPFPTNGLNQDVMFHPPYGMSHLGQPGVGNGIPNLVYGYNLASLYQNAQNSRKTKRMTNCHNCGSSKHSAQDCTENSMETMAGHFHYSYVPKTDSD